MKAWDLATGVPPPETIDVGCVIVGGGPSGTGPLVYAGWAGRLDDFLADGVALVEESGELCTGAVPTYDILSNSPGDRFLEALEHPGSRGAFPRASISASRVALDRCRTKHIPLPLAASLLREVGLDLRAWFERQANAYLLDRCRVDHVRQVADGRYEALVESCREPRRMAYRVRAKSVLIATGGSPVVDRETGAELLRQCERVGNQPNFVTSQDLITRTVSTRDILSSHKRGVVIIGGSHSAFSVAGLLLSDFPPEWFREGDIVVAHRRRIKLFYDSAAHAQADGYDEFSPEDVCPQTNRIYRVGGLRGAARELYRRVTLAPGTAPERRIRLFAATAKSTSECWPIDWSRLGAVIFATGYKLREVPIFDIDGAEIPLLGTFTGRYVDTRSQMLRSDGRLIPNIYSVGAATGYLPQSEFGGETSFMGRENSIWLCQHGLGKRLAECLLSPDLIPVERSARMADSDSGA